MIFSIEGHIQQLIDETKTMTRRPTDRYKIGGLYAIQLGRGEPGIPEGKLYIGSKYKEWKSDLSDLPEDAKLARAWRKFDAGYPIHEWAAKAEGGYTPEEFEELYEKMYPGWTERWAYHLCFFTTKELEEIGELQTSSRSANEN